MTPTTTPPQRNPTQQRALKLFIVLERAANAVMSRLLKQADQLDLTHTEFEILEALYHKGPLLLGDVQKKILLSSGGVTYTIDRLAEKGLVERRECATDRRARYAALTQRGEQLIAKIFPIYAGRIEEVMGALSGSEQDKAIELLRKLGLSAAGQR